MIEALARRGRHRHEPGADRRLGLRRRRSCPSATRAADRLGRRLAPGQPGRQSVRQPVAGLHPIVDLNPMELLELEDDCGRRRGRAARGRWASTCRSCFPAAAARRSAPLRDAASPKGVSFTLDGRQLRWQNWSMRLGFNYREGLVLHTVGYERRRPAPPGRAPDVVRRDGRSLPRPEPRPLPPDRVRHRRVGPGLHDHVAGARLRLPGRDRLPRRRACTTRAASRARSATRSASTRRTTASCGSTSTTHRRRDAAGATAGDLVPRDRRQLRVPRLLALLPGRQHRVRGPRDRDHGDDAVPRRPAAAYGTLVDERTYAPFHQHFIVARLDLDVDGARTTRSYASESEPLPVGRTNPHGLALVTQRDAAADRVRGRPGLRLGNASAPGRSPAASVGTASAPRSRYKLVPGGGDPVADRPGLAGVPARRGDRAHAVGHAVRGRRALAVRRVPQPERAPTRAARSGPRRIARSRTPTSCSGTCSGSTTSPGPRTGR